MKNKFRLTVAILLVTLVASLFSGCFLFEDIQSISLVGQPKTQYKVGEELDTDSFKIKLQYKTSANDKEVGYHNNINVQFENNFSSEKVGSYKCVINIKGNSNISLSFDYSVVEGTIFEEGDGSLNNPYVVTTVEQFAHIGDTAGNYYELGNNISLDGTKSYNVTYNTNKNSFVLDGQNYTIDIGGYYAYAFAWIKDATVKNLVFRVRPGVAHETVLATDLGGEVTFENITTEGTMEAEQNTAMLACRTQEATKVTVKNCTNKVNFTGTAPYCGAFIGLADSRLKELTFENCVNQGNFEATTAWMLVANCAHVVESINVKNCRNEGKFTSAGNGMLNFGWGSTATKSYLTLADYAGEKNSSRIKSLSVTANASDFVVIKKFVVTDSKDKTLVNAGGTVKFSDEAKSKLTEEFGSNGYNVVAYVRDWVDYKDGTAYMFTDNFGLDFAAPYSAVVSGTDAAEIPEGAIKIVDGKLVLAKTINGITAAHRDTKNQFYCYYIYDAQGVMKYCGQIAYADIQNA